MNDKKKKKEFVKPEAEIVDFANDDIITLSSQTEAEWYDGTTEYWG